MFWQEVQHLKASHFKRLTGVTFSTFELLIEAINQYDIQHRKRGNSGRNSHLGTEDKLLMTLMYLREYRTMFHIGITYGLDESNVCRTIRRIEQSIIHHPSLHLPGKRVLTESDHTFEVVLIDVAETPIERPKKNKEDITQARRKDIR